MRLVERNYFAQMFAPAKDTDKDWARMLGQDLREPKFVMSLKEAMSRRLRRNYVWMFLIMLLAWVLKISIPETSGSGAQRDVVTSLREIVGNAALGPCQAGSSFSRSHCSMPGSPMRASPCRQDRRTVLRQRAR